MIAGGIGARAMDLLSAASVQVLAGISASDPEVIVSTFLNENWRPGYPVVIIRAEAASTSLMFLVFRRCSYESFGRAIRCRMLSVVDTRANILAHVRWDTSTAS